MNILITSADWKAALTCMRSLAKKGHRISLISHDKYTPALYSKFCHERIIAPSEKNKEQYLEFLLQLICNKKYDVLFPISDLCIEYFSEIRKEIAKYTKILLPSQEAIDIARNKDKTYRYAYENNIPIPKTYFPQNFAQVAEIADSLIFPCVVKKPKGQAGSGNTYINDTASLFVLFKNISTENTEWSVIQEFIKGKCCGAVAVCSTGKLINFFMHEKLRQYPESGGVTVYGRSFYNESIYEISALLIKKLQWSGPISFDYFIAENKIYLLEINPRFSAVTQFAYSCGIDLAHSYLKIIMGNVDTKPQSYKINVRYRSVFTEEIRSCIKNVKYWMSFFVNFLRLNMHYDFSIFDPNLLFWQFKNAKWDIFES